MTEVGEFRKKVDSPYCYLCEPQTTLTEILREKRRKILPTLAKSFCKKHLLFAAELQ